MTAPRQLRSGTQRHSNTHRWMQWRILITLIGSLAIAWPLAGYAQQPKAPLKRVGFLSTLACPHPLHYAIFNRLAELGWNEGQNYVVDCVSTVGRLDQLPALARELVSRHPEALLATPATVVRALKKETTTIPIVMMSTSDPVGNGIVTNLA